MIIGLDWVGTIFQIPFIMSLFGLMVLSVVIGFRSAIGASLIGSIPSFFITAIDYIAIWSGGSKSAQMMFDVNSTCTGLKGKAYTDCFTSIIHSPAIDWLNTLIPIASKIPNPAPWIILSPIQIVIVSTIGLVLYISLILFIGYYSLKKLIEFRRKIRNQLGKRYTFK